MPKKTTINTSHCRTTYDLLKALITEHGWTEHHTDSNSSKIVWFEQSTNPELVEMIRQLKPSQRVSKFPGLRDVVEKIPFFDLVRRLGELHEGEFQFCPKTWLVPKELAELKAMLEEAQKQGQDLTYILKPTSGSGGDGIMLIKKHWDLPLRQIDGVVQEYISRPLLLDGFKWDLRLYVLISSIDPLKAYIANEGLARFCTTKYQVPNSANIGMAYMHLTNYCLNKHSENYEFRDEVESSDGSKQLFSALMERLRNEEGVDTRAIWKSICGLVAKSLLIIQPKVAELYEGALSGVPVPESSESASTSACRAFQILGFDVLVDTDHNAHLLEVNSNPSMRIDYEREVSPGVSELLPSPIDLHVKKLVVGEAIKIVTSNPSSRAHSDSELDIFEELNFEREYAKGIGLLQSSRKCLKKFRGVRDPSGFNSTQFQRFCRTLGLFSDPPSPASPAAIAGIRPGNFQPADTDIIFRKVVPRGTVMGTVELLDACVCVLEKTQKGVNRGEMGNVIGLLLHSASLS